MIRLNSFIVKETNTGMRGQVIPYGIRMVGAPLEWRETMGEGIRIGVIDTGVDRRHPDLKDRIRDYRNFTDPDIKNVTDENGHGTHVCGSLSASNTGKGVVGVAPRSELYVAKAFDKDGASSEDRIINALYWLAEKEVHIVNMSFSATDFTDKYRDVIGEIYQKDIIMVAAAGNQGEMGVGYPAKFPSTITVAAVDMMKRTTAFSSVGDEIDVCAAGKDVYSTYPNNKYALLSGTSMATPLISGSVALFQGKALLRYGKVLPPEEIRLLLQMYSEDFGEYQKDPNYGYGLFSFGRVFGKDRAY